MTTSMRRFVVIGLASSGLYAIALAAVAHAQPYDHLACYKVKDLKTFTSAPATLSALQSQFAPLGCEIKGKARHPGTAVITVSANDGTGKSAVFTLTDTTSYRAVQRQRCQHIPAD